MTKGEVLVVDQAGTTGPVNEMFRQVLANPALRMELGDVATAREEHVGDRLGDHDPACPEQWADKRLRSLDELAHLGNGAVVFSGLLTYPAGHYEDQLAEGRLVVTNASANRTRPDVALANAFINPSHIDELFSRDMPGRIIAGGNCTSNILTVPLFPLHQAIGVTGVGIETLQGWSGAGYDEVPTDKDDIFPIEGDERDKLKTEPNMLLGASMEEPAALTLSAHPNRGPWVRGHHVKARTKLARATSKEEIEHIWRHFKVSGALEAVRPEVKALSQVEKERWPGRHHPIKPVKLAFHNLVRFDTSPIRLCRTLPMRVNAHIQDIELGNPRVLTFEASGDNLILGAVGVNLLNVIYARAMSYI